MGESNEERLARKKRERAEYLRQEKEDAELAKKLDADPEFAKDFDDSFERGLDALNTEFLDKYAKDKGMSTSEAEAMKKAADRARKAIKGGFFSAGDPDAAEKIIMSNRGLREARKSKADKGCAVIALALVGGVGTLIYGLAEAVGALFG